MKKIKNVISNIKEMFETQQMVRKQINRIEKKLDEISEKCCKCSKTSKAKKD